MPPAAAALDQKAQIDVRFLAAKTRSSLSLAMDLTTILTTIWVCPPKSD
jgi:hypothetical protein